MPINNKHKLSLPLSLFLAHDDYDHIDEKNYISATKLITPIRALILSMRTPNTDIDVLDLLASRIGTASHDRLEKAFLNGNYKVNMRKLGYDEELIKRTKINPESVSEGDNPIYLEKRSIKELHGYKIGGKFDVVLNDGVRDLKTTKTFTYVKTMAEQPELNRILAMSKEECESEYLRTHTATGADTDYKFELLCKNCPKTMDYVLQGSIYRWLNQDIITKPTMHIDFIFTDWKAYEADAKLEYPQQAALSVEFPLMSLNETEEWLTSKINNINKYKDLDQDQMPECNIQELWQDPPKYKYFKNPLGKRATKVFDSLSEANQRLITDGSVGKIDTHEGKPKRCLYCSGAVICKQAQMFIADGLL